MGPPWGVATAALVVAFGALMPWGPTADVPVEPRVATLALLVAGLSVTLVWNLRETRFVLLVAFLLAGVLAAGHEYALAALAEAPDGGPSAARSGPWVVVLGAVGGAVASLVQRPRAS